MSNQIRTTILLAVMTALIVWIGGLIGGRGGMMIALVFAAGMNFFSYWFSDRIVLSMYQAKEATPAEAPELYEMVRTLAERAGLPVPKIYVIPDETPNAFATGRNPDHAVVAVTEGLLRIMEREEIMGVLAHELGHVKNRDILIGSIAATMAGAVMMLANMARWSAVFGGARRDEGGGGLGGIGLILTSLLAPVAAVLIQMAISRSREYLADETSANLNGDPEGLSRALEKLGTFSGKMLTHARPETAHMFIVNPLSGRSLMGLFSTHPPLEDRIARLRGISPGSSGGSGKNRKVAESQNIWDRLSG